MCPCVAASMAPASSGGTAARQFRYDFQDDDLLGGPQPFSGTLQTVTIVGLEGKAESGDGMQKWGRDSFAVVGAGGVLKTCSDVRAATCAAVCAQLREGSTGSLEVWFKATRHAWSGAWTFQVLWALEHAASSSEGEDVASASAGASHDGGPAQQEEDEDGGGDLSGCPATFAVMQNAAPADAVPSGPGLAELLLAAGGDGGDLGFDEWRPAAADCAREVASGGGQFFHTFEAIPCSNAVVLPECVHPKNKGARTQGQKKE